LAKELRKAIRKAASDGNVEAPVNVRRAINIGHDSSTATASATQHVVINQSTRDRPEKTDDA
jgi:hypothetical protein